MECALLNNMATPAWIQSSENVRPIEQQEQIAYFETGLNVNNHKVQPTSPERDEERSQVVLSPLEPNLSVKLQDKEIWNKFSAAQTEMIVTKPGRRIFPGYRVKLSGLEPNAHYCVLMDVISMDDNRYKFQNGQWVVSGRGEPRLPPKFYLHPKSPSTGSKWMKDLVSFHKVKLTNSFSKSDTDKFNVHSMHRYQMRLHIVRTSDVSKIQYEPMSTFAFTKTTFITVTAYQNHEVTQLKIENNPFARGFRSDGGKTKNARCVSGGDELTGNLRPHISYQTAKRSRNDFTAPHIPPNDWSPPQLPNMEMTNGYTSFQPQISPEYLPNNNRIYYQSSSPGITQDPQQVFFPHTSPLMTYEQDPTRNEYVISGNVSQQPYSFEGHEHYQRFPSPECNQVAYQETNSSPPFCHVENNSMSPHYNVQQADTISYSPLSSTESPISNFQSYPVSYESKNHFFNPTTL